MSNGKFQLFLFASILLIFSCKKDAEESPTPNISGPPSTSIHSANQFYLMMDGVPYYATENVNNYIELGYYNLDDSGPKAIYTGFIYFSNGNNSTPTFFCNYQIIKNIGDLLTIDDVRNRLIPGSYPIAGSDPEHSFGFSFQTDSLSLYMSNFDPVLQANSSVLITDTLSGFDSLYQVDFFKFKAKFTCKMTSGYLSSDTDTVALTNGQFVAKILNIY